MQCYWCLVSQSGLFLPSPINIVHQLGEVSSRSLSHFVLFCVPLLLVFIQIVKLEQHQDERVAHIHLFIGTDSQDLEQSVNRQLAQSHLWNRASAPERNGGDAKG